MYKLAINNKKPILKKSEGKYIWPRIDQGIRKAVLRQLDDTVSIYDKSGIFEKFEKKFSELHDMKYGLLFNSGTTAIHAMYVALELKDGDEVICPAYTFFATVTPMLFTGAVPILCDCDENGNIDPLEIENKVTNKTKAVIITHMWGVPCQMNKIVEICKKHNLKLLEDCSHAHGAKYDSKMVGTFGAMAVWSLQGQKNITGGEGGILLTNEEKYYNRALILGHYNKRCKQEIKKDDPLYEYSLTGMGLKYRAHPLAVAIAMEILKKYKKNQKIKEKNAKRIINSLRNFSTVLRPPILQKNIKPSWYALLFQYDPQMLSNIDIKIFVNACIAEGLIEADNPGSTMPLNMTKLFQKPSFLFPNYNFSYKVGDFPKAEEFYKNAFKLPVWSDIADTRIVDLYVEGIKKVINNHRELL